MPDHIVAIQRRARAVQDLQGKRARTLRERDRGAHNSQGFLDPYLVDRQGLLQGELHRLDTEIEALQALEGDELNRRFVPEAYSAAEDEPIPLNEMLKRGKSVTALPLGAM
jgi:hypothetical protein